MAGLVLGLAALWAGGEAWRRAAVPFEHSLPSESEFRPGIGYIAKPYAEMRYTNSRDFWSVQTANSLGFLDREPPSAARAKAACHVAVIGDSFVEAMEVALEHKLQVRLEALAAERLPERDVIVSAYSRAASGQVAQLPIYDQYVRPLAPKLVVLVFFVNDFRDNFTPLRGLHKGWRRFPFPVALPDGQGGFLVHPPAADYREHGVAVPPRSWVFLPVSSAHGSPRLASLLNRIERRSWFLKYAGKIGLKQRRPARDLIRDQLAKAPDMGTGFSDLSWVDTMTPDEKNQDLFARETLPPALAAGLAYTGFGLQEFKARAQRDGAALVLLATEDVGSAGTPMFDRLARLASAAGIDVVSLHEFMVRRGADFEAAQFEHDWHWTPAGHAWAAEALFEYLDRHQSVCDARP